MPCRTYKFGRLIQGFLKAYYEFLLSFTTPFDSIYPILRHGNLLKLDLNGTVSGEAQW